MASTGTHSTAEEKLLVAAKREFALRGYEGATVRRIAKEAGVNIGLVSYHFGGKRGLYRACLERYGRERLGALTALLDPADSPEALRLRLRLVLAGILDAHLRDPDLTRMVLNEVEAEAPIAGDIVRNTMFPIAQAFVSFFADAQHRGLVRENVDPLFLTQLIQGGLNHFVRSDFVRRAHFGHSIAEEEERDKLVNNLLALLLVGIEPARGAPEPQAARP